MASWFRSKPSSGSSDASLEKQASDLLGGASDALRGLLVDPANQNVIKWDSDAREVVILDKPLFIQTLLPRTFKTHRALRVDQLPTAGEGPRPGVLPLRHRRDRCDDPSPRRRGGSTPSTRSAPRVRTPSLRLAQGRACTTPSSDS